MFRAFAHGRDQQIMIDGSCNDNPDSESQDQNAHRTVSREITVKRLSQNYGEERALGHSSASRKAASPQMHAAVVVTT
jgi:hypothetical protein